MFARLALAFLLAIPSFASPISESHLHEYVKRASRSSPPSGAVVVRKSPQSGEFATVQAAVNSLPNDSSSRVIFIYGGTYTEQVSITRSGPLTIFGATSDTSNYASNQVTITQSKSAGQAGSDDASGTLRVNKNDFKLYNVNVKNTFGQAASNGQALALSATGSRHGYYAAAFYSYQDTVLSETGTHYFGHAYIEGAVDYIFGQHARAFFQKNTIASIGAGAITASGRPSSSDVSLYVINQSNIIQSSAATSSLTGKVFLGRPWADYARVAFTSCSLGSLINGAGWEQWNTGDPRTDHVTFAEYASTGAGASGTRASFSTKLSSTSGYGIADVLGSDWASWVDQTYV